MSRRLMEEKMVQLHSYITQEVENKITELQALMRLKKNQKISKQAIILKSLNDYLDYAINQLHEDTHGK